jgi:hypothetical protein
MSRSPAPSTSSMRTRPSRSVGSLYAKPRYMGDHPLFHNAVTAKRFPALASVPSEQLAAAFNVDPVDKEALQREELMYHEEHQDKRPPLRDLPPLPPGAAPFRPSNSSQAARTIRTPAGSVFCGYNAHQERIDRVEAERDRERRARLTDTKFAFGTPTEARTRIANNTYLYSLDEKTAELVRDITERRLREQRERTVQTLYGHQSASASRGSSRGARR